jgi:uncharacterized protein YuzE
MKPLICALFLITDLLNAQLGDRFYGPGVFQNIMPSGYGNYYVLGTTGNGYQAWILKLDKDLNKIWEKTYYGPSGERVNSSHIMIDLNGDLIISGQVISGTYKFNGWALKTNKDGQLLWSKIFTSALNLYYACENKKNGYYFGGQTAKLNDGIVIDVDNNGNESKSLTIEIASYTKVKYVEANNDGTISLIGRSHNNGAAFGGIFYLKITYSGIELLRTVYHTDYKDLYDQTNYTHSMGISRAPNGNLLISDPVTVNTPYGYLNDCLVLEIDENGVIRNKLQFGNIALDEKPFNIIHLNNGEYIGCGEVEYYDGTSHSYSYSNKFTLTGNEEWRRYYHYNFQNARLLGAVELANHDLVFCGVAKNSQACLLRTNASGRISNYSITGYVKMDMNANCISDSMDKLISSVLVSKNNGSPVFVYTDANGQFTLNTDDVKNDLTIFPADDYSMPCQVYKTVVIDSILQTASVDFLMQPIDACAHLKVDITQPDLVKCKVSKYQVFVKNYGIDESEPQNLQIQFDPRLLIQRYTTGGSVNQNVLTYQLNPVKYNEQLLFEFEALLPCDVLIGSFHPVSAKLINTTCKVPWNGPELKVSNECRGNEIVFKIENTGADMTKELSYKMYADPHLIEEASIKLIKNEIKELKFPANGKTYDLEIFDTHSILKPGTVISSVLEACGRNKNGLYSTMYAGAYRRYNADDRISEAFGFNSSGIPDKVQQMREGYGWYNFITKNEWMEYTLRARNPLNRIVNEVDMQINISDPLDLKSLQVLGSSNKLKIIPIDSQNLKIILSDCKLASTNTGPDENVYVKIKIKAADNTPFDASVASYLSVSAKLFFDQVGPFELRPSRNNLTTIISFQQQTAELYPEGISLFGGKYIDFGSKIAHAADGSVFLLSQSASYSDGHNYQALVIKLDNHKQVLWYSLIPSRIHFTQEVRDLIVLPDGGCMIVGSSLDENIERVNNNYEAMVIRVDSKGEEVFTKYYKPGLNLHGGIANAMKACRDGNFLISGISTTGETNEQDSYLMKIDIDGNLIWLKNYIVNNRAFEVYSIYELNDGKIICTGTDYGRGLIIAQKTDANGNQIWMKTHTPQLTIPLPGQVPLVLPSSSVITKSGEILFLLFSEWQDSVSGQDLVAPLFIKLTENGEFIGEKRTLVGPAGYGIGVKIVQDSDDSFVIFGEVLVDTKLNTGDILVARFDSNFDLMWFKNYGSAREEWLVDGLIGDEGRIYGIGYNQLRSPDLNLQTIYLQMDRHGELVNSNQLDYIDEEQLMVYPNPANEKLNVFFFNDSKIAGTTWKFFSLNGDFICKGSVQSNKLTIDVQEIPNGIYFLKFGDPSLHVKKIIVNH